MIHIDNTKLVNLKETSVSFFVLSVESYILRDLMADWGGAVGL